MSSESNIQRAERILGRDWCACGHTKLRGYAFCWPCYRGLPGTYRVSLRRHARDGFVEAYDRAVEYLRAKSPEYQANNVFWDGERLRENPPADCPDCIRARRDADQSMVISGLYLPPACDYHGKRIDGETYGQERLEAAL